ncbi:MAG TPA: DUF3027 domain-containing protein [Mycobacteriales bacterium]|nr:DUF3027 domain-containing protein [Mycobacteriales bacterium]
MSIPDATPPSGRPDTVLAAAQDVALAAAREEAGLHGRVGAHLGVVPAHASAGAKAARHAFACEDPGYVGWYWAVELVRAPRSKRVTVDEVVLLPGPDAIQSPEWVPWAERLRPGDVGPGDVLPTAADDVRLTLRQADTEGWIDDTLWLELGLGRARVLSPDGREQAVERWYDGESGPDSELARSAPKPCGSCGFYVGLTGVLGRVFGVCANEWAHDDGKVVSLDHGCGAHSEAMVLPSAHPAPLQLDDEAMEPVGVGAHSAGSVDDEALGEPGGHS